MQNKQEASMWFHYEVRRRAIGFSMDDVHGENRTSSDVQKSLDKEVQWFEEHKMH